MLLSTTIWVRLYMVKQANKGRKVFYKGDSKLLLYNTFVYEVLIYKITQKSYTLEDSKYISTSKFTKDITRYFNKKKIKYVKHIKLIAASLIWLLENKYEENGKVN